VCYLREPLDLKRLMVEGSPIVLSYPTAIAILNP
jgi:hypothetical protein